MQAVAEKTAAGVFTGVAMAWIGAWEGFVLLGAFGGIVGHVVWAERFPEIADLLTARQHARKIFRNMIVSGFLGALIFLGALKFGMERDPVAYLFTGVAGMFSIEFAVLAMELGKDALRSFANRIGGSS